MVSGTSTLDAAAILAEARAARRDANAAEARVLARAVEWAHLHVVEDLDDAATWWVGSRAMGQDTGIPIAGEGCPLVAEFAIPELATALGLSQGSGRRLVADALELAHRLPRLWARVQHGTLAPWRARRIAEQTQTLSFEAAAFVDDQVAPYAHKTGLAQTQRLVEDAIARFMPEHAAERRDRAADQRHVSIDHQQVSFQGTVRIQAEVDLVDGLDLDDAIARDAAHQRALGSVETLDIRRSVALGNLARRDLTLDLDLGTGSDAPTARQPVATTAAAAATPTATGDCGTKGLTPSSSTAGQDTNRSGQFGRRRDVVLYVHLTDQILRSGDPDAPVRVENAGGQLLTAGQVADWCRRPDTDRITVKPVLDLAQPLHCDTYTPSAALAEQIRLRDRTCVFPYCTRPARSCDLDHIVAWDRGGKTESSNLACLCRLHHRLKTHGGWTYQMLDLGVFLWQSPYGYHYRRDPTGTQDITPKPAPPGSPGNPGDPGTDPPHQ